MRRTGLAFLEAWAYLLWRRGQIDTTAQLLCAWRRKLWRREMTVKPPTSPPRWVVAKVGRTAVRAIVFAADRKGQNYATGLTDEEIAGVLCKAVGHWGSGAEYLMQTVDHLEQCGIRDSNLWRLQRLCAGWLFQMRDAAR